MSILFCSVLQLAMYIAKHLLCALLLYFIGTILDYFLLPFSTVLAPLSSFITTASVKKINKRYLDLLILPKSHHEMNNWHGTYCVIQDTPTYWQVN